MNYRHSFHAGNFADVHKHVVLLAVLEQLQRKATPAFYLDTHAGRGVYPLATEPGAEWHEGIGRIFAAAPRNAALQRYLQAVRSLNPGGRLLRYPGSPLLARDALRPIDRAVFVEQQPAEARALHEAVHAQRVATVCGDGYQALQQELPPQENRGLVLIDPPYEDDQEFTTLQRSLQLALKCWRNGIFACWYPLKAGLRAQRFHDGLAQSGLRKLLLLELSIRPADSPIGLNGSGMLLANPPWQLDLELGDTLLELHRLLVPGGAGSVRVHWLVPE
jgi:23S rRNA (adenine2030-N6)-methyltransferase